MTNREYLFDAIRPYMHEDAKRVLDQQIPLIRQRVDESVDRFVESYATRVKKEVDTLLESTKAELTTSQNRLKEHVDSIVATSNAAGLSTQAQELQAELRVIEEKYKRMGESLRTAAVQAAKAAATSAGIPSGLLG